MQQRHATLKILEVTIPRELSSDRDKTVSESVIDERVQLGDGPEIWVAR